MSHTPLDRSERAKRDLLKFREEEFLLTPDGRRRADIPKGVLDGLCRNLNQAIQHLSDGLYSESVHFVFELLQNAEDNSYGVGVVPELKFQLLLGNPTGLEGVSHTLVVTNNELGFQPDEVRALCAVGKSTKKKEQGYIGEKGIGFKSVFQISSCPHVFSNGYAFRLPKEEPVTGIGFIVPIWVDDVPPIVDQEKTTLLLPLDRGRHETIVQELRDLQPLTILFLSKIRELHIEVEGQFSRTISRRDMDRGTTELLTRHSTDGGATWEEESRFYWVHTQTYERPQEVDADKRDEVKSRPVTVAFCLTEPADAENKVYAYLPTRERSGLPFALNADFLLPSSREGIKQDEAWNHWLATCVPEVFISAYRKLLENEEWSRKAYAFIPLGDEVATLFQESASRIIALLRSEPIIHCEGASQLVLPARATVVSHEFRDTFLLSDDPHPLVSEKPVVERTVQESYNEQLQLLECPVLPLSDLLSWLDPEEWLRRRPHDWFIELYRYLKTRDWNDDQTEELRTKDIVPLEDGGLSCAARLPLYLHLDKESRQILDQVPANLRPRLGILASPLWEAIQEQEDIVSWLSSCLAVHQFSPTFYCIDIQNLLTERGEELAPRELIEATVVAAKLCGEPARLKGFPVLLEGDSVWTPEEGYELAIPEGLEPGDGWQHVFPDEEDREHIRALSQRYIDSLGDQELKQVLGFLRELGLTDAPLPRTEEFFSIAPSTGMPSSYLTYLRARKAYSTRGSRFKVPRAPHWLQRLLASPEASPPSP